MTSTANPTVKDKKIERFGLVESASVNSITDFTPSKLTDTKANNEKEKEDFLNTFICHLIFYLFLLISLVLHILIDLGLGDFLKTQISNLMEFKKKNVVKDVPSFP